MPTSILNKQKRSVNIKKIQENCDVILKKLNAEDFELSILLTDDEEIRELNKTYRNKDKATNVLSFPMNESEKELFESKIAGDIALSIQTAKEEAKKNKTTLQERISQLLVHGILHLFFYDHEKSDQMRIKMEKKSLELLSFIEKNKALEAF